MTVMMLQQGINLGTGHTQAHTWKSPTHTPTQDKLMLCVICASLKEHWRKGCVCLAVEVKYQQAFSRIIDYTFKPIKFWCFLVRFHVVRPMLINLISYPDPARSVLLYTLHSGMMSCTLKKVLQIKNSEYKLTLFGMRGVFWTSLLHWWSMGKMLFGARGIFFHCSTGIGYWGRLPAMLTGGTLLQ